MTEDQPDWEIHVGEESRTTRITHQGVLLRDVHQMYLALPYGEHLLDVWGRAGSKSYGNRWNINAKRPAVVRLQLIADREDILGYKLHQVKAGETLRITGILGDHEVTITEDWPAGTQ